MAVPVVGVDVVFSGDPTVRDAGRSIARGSKSPPSFHRSESRPTAERLDVPDRAPRKWSIRREATRFVRVRASKNACRSRALGTRHREAHETSHPRGESPCGPLSATFPRRPATAATRLASRSLAGWGKRSALVRSTDRARSSLSGQSDCRYRASTCRPPTHWGSSHPPARRSACARPHPPPRLGLPTGPDEHPRVRWR